MVAALKVDVECVLDVRNTLGESPLWSAREQALYWVDILGARVLRWHPADGAQSIWELPAAVGCIGLRESGGLVAALRTGIHLLDLDSARLTLVCAPEAGIPTNRFNDGKVSPDGRFWAGTMDDRPEREPVASLYRVDPDHRCTRMVTGLKVSNGLAWSLDGRTMYHSDSRAGMIWRYAYDPGTGHLGEREVFVALEPEWGRPDGAAIDEEGCYWSCGISAGRVNRFDPRGALIAYVELPVTHPTMPCFGGPDGRTLYVTTSRENFTAAQVESTPRAGSLFAFEPGVAGPAAALYRG